MTWTCPSHSLINSALCDITRDTLAQAADLVPLLLQTVEKAAAQSSQTALLAEGTTASVLLCRLSLLDSQPETKFANFWKLILDEKNPLFTTEKFLSQANDETLCTVLQLCERLFLDHAHRLSNSKSNMYHSATVAVLLSRSWRVRKRAQQTVKKLLSSLGGSSLAHGLLGELRAVINKHKVLPPDVLLSESGELTELGRSYVPPRVLLDALCTICCSAGQWGDPNEAQNLAMETVIISHHPSIVEARPGLWPVLLSSMNVKTEEFIERNLEALLPHLLEVNADNQAVKNAVGALSDLSPNKLLPRVIGHVIEGFSRPALLQVTRDEYNIMLTPAGELYDKSIIQSAKQEVKSKNIKRENKAYSFKDQIIEMEIEEEIRKKKGIKDEVQLTAKQKEMVQAQLEKEASIRKRLQEMDAELQSVVGLLEQFSKRILLRSHRSCQVSCRS
ncbi:hypothetical protein WMY93_004047 [Mugilogobius chulae]|uniref:Uncharacterized protein n=1 Tax=Mugilogobius chulae TaxID=88201 RepID=A0AAW0PQZ4_9GOBI